MFFSALRLCDRLNLQFRLRGEKPRVPRGLAIATCVTSVIPYVNILIGFPIMWTIMVCRLQSTVNRVERASADLVGRIDAVALRGRAAADRSRVTDADR